jgi:uncharacterized membrane protein
MLAPVLAVPLLLAPVASTATAAPAPTVVCHGDKPSWSLRVEGAAATLSLPGVPSRALDGRLVESRGSRLPFLVYRAKDGVDGDLVALITAEACRDATTAQSGSDGISTHTVRVSLANGEVLEGCCRLERAPAAEAHPAPSAPAPRPAAGIPAATGSITAVALPDGTVCRASGRSLLGPGGRPLTFECDHSGVDVVALLGPLTAEPSGLLSAQRAELTWNEGDYSVRREAATPVRVSEIAFSDGLECRGSGAGATVAFGGRRAAFTCGTREGARVVLLGDLEPAEGGLRVTRARVVTGDGGFTLAGEESLLVTLPR